MDGGDKDGGDCKRWMPFEWDKMLAAVDIQN